MSDVPVGVLLSGGIDSTTLVSLLKEQAAGLASFSVGYRDDAAIDESEEARWVAKRFGTAHHEVLISEREALDFLPRLIHHQDEPLADPVCIPVHFVCELARQNGVKVVLAGEGADEMFWGYPRYIQVLHHWRQVAPLLRLPIALRSVVERSAGLLGNRRAKDYVASVARGRPLPIHMPLGMASGDRDSILGRSIPGFGWAPGNPWPGETSLDRLMFDTQEYEFQLRLPELLLMRIDRFSMANSVEARVPFLDPGLVEYAYRLPLELKLHDGVAKRVLRRAVRGAVPDRVLSRPKQGFGAPISRWFNAGMGSLFDGLFGSEAIGRYFDRGRLEQILAAHRQGGHHEFVLWPVLNFALWHRYWIEGQPIDDLVAALSVAA